jgi:hypothetical protein
LTNHGIYAVVTSVLNHPLVSKIKTKQYGTIT